VGAEGRKRIPFSIYAPKPVIRRLVDHCRRLGVKPSRLVEVWVLEAIERGELPEEPEDWESTVFSVSLDSDLIAKVKELADERGTTASQLVLHVIKRRLNIS